MTTFFNKINNRDNLFFNGSLDDFIQVLLGRLLLRAAQHIRSGNHPAGVKRGTRGIVQHIFHKIHSLFIIVADRRL